MRSEKLDGRRESAGGPPVADSSSANQVLLSWVSWLYLFLV